MNDPMMLARHIAINQEINEAAEQWIINAFSAWWRDGSDPVRLPAFLRLPTGSRHVTAERNRWLVIAANELDDKNRAAALKKLIDSFMRYRWPQWRSSTLPPEDAAPIDKALFFAADQGAAMQLTRRQVCNILNGK